MFSSYRSRQPYGLLARQEQQAVPLPLIQVTARVALVDLSAQVQLRQVYRNDSSSTLDAAYVFPVPDRAAVCAFAMVKQDGSRVVGVVEEKEEARQQYEEAVQAGKLASLAEQATPDTFKCSVGNILPNETVVIELTYVTELAEGETSDSIRFHLPSRVGARYGGPPSGLFGASPLNIPPSSSVSFDLAVSIETAAAIGKIVCPSHTVSTSLGPDPSLPDSSSLPSSNYARVSFSTTQSLERDFVLELSSAGLDAPRCFAEKHPTADSTTVSLTVVPRFKLPEVEGQEYIFLVDRSGSMGGNRIEMARKALVVLLRSLPHKGTTFNIVSFGSNNEALWPEGSRAYNQSTLGEATSLVDSMNADFGGTEMKNALEAVFALRKTDRPTSVFVLTDGDAWDLDNVYASVKSAVSASTTATPLRLFVLGIGNSASTAMCEGIARHGNGLAQFCVDGESFTGKTTRLLKAARTPPILNARLDFGVKEQEEVEDFEVVEAEAEGEGNSEQKVKAEKVGEGVASLSLFDETVDPLAEGPTAPLPPLEPVQLPPPSAVQQAPYVLRSVYPGTRLHTYAILSPSSLLPPTVFLCGELVSGQKLELAIPVVSSRLRPSASSPFVPPPIHTLAARKLIQELEDGSRDLSASIPDGDLRARTVKAQVVRLGKTYSLASSHTSFVAVDESEVDKPRRRIPAAPPAPTPQPVFRSGGGTRRMRTWAASSNTESSTLAPTATLYAAPAPAGLYSGNAACKASAGVAAPPVPSSGGLLGDSPIVDGAVPGSSNGGGGSFGSGAVEESVVSLAAFAPPPPHKARSTAAAPMTSSQSAAVPPHPTPPSIDPAALVPSDRLDAIARLQSFDGSFSPSVLLFCGVALPACELIAKLPVELQSAEKVEEVVATLVVLAYWQREMKQLEDEWCGMAEKARAFVAAATGRARRWSTSWLGSSERLSRGFEGRTVGRGFFSAVAISLPSSPSASCFSRAKCLHNSE
ncbi:hypothetical protein JCM10213_002807 [Rhodosporidiobolus nylandii]